MKSLYALFFCCLLAVSFVEGQDCSTDCICDSYTEWEEDENLGNGLCEYTVTFNTTISPTPNVKLLVFQVGDSIFMRQAENPGFPAGPLDPPFVVKFTTTCVTELEVSINAYKGNGSGSLCGSESAIQVAGIGGPLPVELIYFNARLAKDQNVMVEWATATELNNDYFELQHSTDGRNFEPLVKVEGNGTTDLVQYYHYLHETPTVGTNYYRIKQVDYDGKYEIFDAATVKVTPPDDFKLFPSQTLDLLTLESPVVHKKDLEVNIYSPSGMLMQSGILAAGTNRIQFNVQDLPAGIYFIRFVNEENDYTARQFVKMRE